MGVPKYKSAVFEEFKSWEAEVETEAGRRLRCLKSDNGSEYNYSDFMVFCVKHEMKPVRTVPNSPQQIGIPDQLTN